MPRAQLHAVSDSALEQNIREQLDYNAPGIPLGLVLDGQIQLFTEVDVGVHEAPWISTNMYFKQGDLFSLNGTLDRPQFLQPRSVWRMSAGVRLPYVLSTLTNRVSFRSLQRKFEMDLSFPAQQALQWDLFRDLANQVDFPNPWYVRILFFGKRWADARTSLEEKSFRLLLHERMMQQTAYIRNRVIIDRLKQMAAGVAQVGQSQIRSLYCCHGAPHY